MPTVKDWLQICEREGFKVLEEQEGKPYNLNIVGWRNRLSRPDYFDDTITIYYQSKQRWVSHYFQATTLPGKPSLLKPGNEKGVAILAPGQYRYKVGLHKGKYEALVQAGPVKVYRDGTRDLIFDMRGELVEEGYFGINIHRASLGAKFVGPDSSGCQVIKDRADYEQFISLCKKATSKLFYTLVEI